MGNNDDGRIRRPLLGKGELLKTSAPPPSGGGGDKYHPLSAYEAFELLSPQAQDMQTVLGELDDALRGQHVVFEATLQPNYLANSYFPEIFDTDDLYVVGAKRAKGLYRTKTRAVDDEPTKTLLIAGSVASVMSFADQLKAAPSVASTKMWEDARKLSVLKLPRPADVVRRVPSETGAGEVITWEAVLNPIGRNEYEQKLFGDEAFEKWVRHVENLAGHVNIKYRREVDGITFVPIALHVEAIHDAARFNLLRALRPMPRIRLTVSPILRSVASKPRAPSGDTPPTSDTTVAVFDGGVNAALPAFSTYVTAADLTTEPASDDAVDHGSMVTSALLYGPLAATQKALPAPRCTVDHYRVVPHPPSGDILFDEGAYWILDRMKETLGTGKYAHVSLSLGPDQSVEDDGEPDRWTAELDHLAEEHDITFVVAAGNNGECDPVNGFNRVQVPSDMVNGIGVGACDKRTGRRFGRCAYSPVGPGRDGQRLQPVGLAFGGQMPDSPFYGLDRNGNLASGEGTSYAAPTTSGGLAELAGALGPERAKPEVMRAFAAHFATRPVRHKSQLEQVGYGRFLENYRDVFECEPNECTVLYEDELQRGTTVGLRFPFPEGLPADANLQLRWHLAFMTPVDPRDPVDYTGAGVGIVLRPHERRIAIYDEVSKEKIDIFDLDRDADRIAQMARFRTLKFSDTPIAVSDWRKYRTEGEQRKAGKWETLASGERRFSVPDLYNPRIDVSYFRRERGRLIGGSDVPKLRIAMLLHMKAPKNISLYDLIEQRYPLLTPVVSVRIQVPSAG